MNGATQADLASHQRVPVFDPTGPSLAPYPSFARKTNPPDLADDTELCIFDAEKYFNEVDQLETCGSQKRFLTVHGPAAVPPRSSSISSSADMYGRNYLTRSFRSYVAPTTSSSEVSWHSQTGLLSNPSGSVPVSARGTSCEMKTGTASPRWQLFGTTCPCLGRKSVSISERSLQSEPRSPPQINSTVPRIQPNGHVPRVSNVGTLESKPRNLTSQVKSGKEEMGKSMLNSRHSFSLEAANIFPSEIGCQRSSIIAGRPFSDATTAGFAFLDLKPSGLSAATTRTVTTSPSSPPVKKALHGLTVSLQSPTAIHQPPKNQFFTVPQLRIPIPGRKHGTSSMDNDDAASDASSDLFEIESFATLSAAYPNPSPSATTEPLYEPSEASVTWSVMTADGPSGDRGSVVTNYSVSASDVEEFTRQQRRLHRELEQRGNYMGKGGNIAVVESGKRRSTSNDNGGGFLGCRGEKAVNVKQGPSRAPAISKNGPCRSLRVSVTFAT